MDNRLSRLIRVGGGLLEMNTLIIRSLSGDGYRDNPTPVGR